MSARKKAGRVDYWRDGPWVEYLTAHVPDELRPQVHFRAETEIPRDRGGTLQYVAGEGAVQLRPANDDGSGFPFSSAAARLCTGAAATAGPPPT